MQPTLAQLRQVEILATVPSSDLALLQPQARVVSYPAQAQILTEGEPLDSGLYATIAGRIQVSRVATTGKETILRVLSAGEIFAAPALLGDGVAPATVLALTDCQVVIIERAALLAAIRQAPDIALQMMMVFNQRLQQLHDRIHGLMSERAIVRLARLIAETAITEGSQDQGLLTPLPYYQIARRIGITYEECVRLFKQLQPILHYDRGGTIQILDWAALQAVARGD